MRLSDNGLKRNKAGYGKRGCEKGWRGSGIRGIPLFCDIRYSNHRIIQQIELLRFINSNLTSLDWLGLFKKSRVSHAIIYRHSPLRPYPTSSYNSSGLDFPASRSPSTPFWRNVYFSPHHSESQRSNQRGAEEPMEHVGYRVIYLILN